MSNYLIKNVSVLGGTPTDLLLRDGVIAEAVDEGAETVDATGLVALPGLVDLHTHLREPGREDAETVGTGTQAAALGGFTAVHAMANTEPVADTAGVVEQVWRLGREAGYCDVYPVGAVTVGLQGERLAELGAMADSAAREPVRTVSASSRPGSRRWVCRSTRPGSATSPSASTTSAPVAVRCSPMVAIRPFLIRMSAGSSPYGRAPLIR